MTEPIRPPASRGRVTLPTEVGAEDLTRQMIQRLGADAIRNSDGTDIPPALLEAGLRVYSKYFVNRGDNAWAEAHPASRIELYLCSTRHTARGGPLTIRLLEGFFQEQFAVDVDHDPAEWWQVVDRTTGAPLPTDAWTWDGQAGTVTVGDPAPWHEYTVSFLAQNIWDPVQMYNHLTNDWGGKPHDVPFDLRDPDTRVHARQSLRAWLAANPATDVVRFTTFLYQFTLIFDEQAREKYVDWFGYAWGVGPAALRAFEQAYGYRPSPEDFVDAGYYNSPFRPPSPVFRDWMEFVGRFVTEVAAELVAEVHAAGRQAVMFLGDQWIGTEPYGPRFADIGLDGVVGSVGSAATARVIADIPAVSFTEGRLLPYFFPDVFRPGGDPAGQAREAWVAARRAILRKPLDRIGYGGYLSLARAHPDFLAVAERVVGEFRAIHDLSEGRAPATEAVRVGVLNAWGSVRSWQTHMVAHALWHRHAYTYAGVLEALAGLPFEVEFLSFDQVAADGVPPGLGVVLTAGDMGTSWSGGPVWDEAALVCAVREWVDAGGGLVGVGDPSAWPGRGRTYQLADVLGVDREIGHSVGYDRYWEVRPEHWVAADLGERLDVGEGPRGVYPVEASTQVVRGGSDSVDLAVHPYGRGRGVYLAGLPYCPVNSRLLHRVLLWAGGRDVERPTWWAEDPGLEVTAYPDLGRIAVANATDADRGGAVWLPGGGQVQVQVPAGECRWYDVG